MSPLTVGRVRTVSFVLIALLAAADGSAQVEPDQTLDQVDAFDSNLVLDMAFEDPISPEPGVQDSVDLGVAGGGGIAACKIAPRGLYCLAIVTPQTGTPYQVVRFWEDPKARPAESEDLLRCDDSSLGLHAKPGVAGPCIGLTVDLSGAVWVTGSKDGLVYSLLKIDEEPSVPDCDLAPWTRLHWPATTGLCAAQFASGAGVLSDLDAVDGQEVAGNTVWPFGPGILGIWNGLNASLQPESDTLFFNLVAPTTGSPKSFGPWGLSVGERLLSATLLQVAQPAGAPPKNFILAATNTHATTNKRRIVARAATNPAPVSGHALAFDLSSWESGNPGSTINLGQGTSWSACNGLGVCSIGGTTLTATGGTFSTKWASTGAMGLGVNGGGPTAGEVDVNERVDVVFPVVPGARKVSAIEILFLFNGPEYGDPAEKLRITVDGTTSYTLAMRSSADDDTADWSGPGSVSKCGRAVNAGTGCFLITNPFPAAVSSLRFDADDVTSASNDSDFSIGRIETVYYGVRSSWTTGKTFLSNRDFNKVLALRTATPTAPFPLTVAASTKAPAFLPMVLSTGATSPDGITVAPGVTVDLTEDCPTPIDGSGNGGCVLATNANGAPAAKFGGVQLAANSTASGVTVYKITGLLDCRFLLQDCYALLNPDEEDPVTDAAARLDLIDAGWIVPVTSDLILRLAPAAQLLNVTPQFPEDVTSNFDNSGVPPAGLGPIYISRYYNAPAERGRKFDALFLRKEEGVFFTGTFNGEVDVLGLTGFELGCDPPVPANAPISEGLKWDNVTTASETYPSVNGLYIDTLINVGCRNPTKVSGGKTSLFSVSLAPAHDTFGPTIKSSTPSVTVDNDGVFARLTQGLHMELYDVLNRYTCETTNSPPTRTKPLTKAVCDNLNKLWAASKQKLDKCVTAAFQPKASASNENCKSFRVQFDSYRQALPSTPSGPDLANRLGEQFWRWDVIKHAFETRFLPSIPPNGYCRERTAPSYAGCPAL